MIIVIAMFIVPCVVKRPAHTYCAQQCFSIFDTFGVFQDILEFIFCDRIIMMHFYGKKKYLKSSEFRKICSPYQSIQLRSLLRKATEQLVHTSYIDQLKNALCYCLGRKVEICAKIRLIYLLWSARLVLLSHYAISSYSLVSFRNNRESLVIPVILVQAFNASIFLHFFFFFNRWTTAGLSQKST